MNKQLLLQTDIKIQIHAELFFNTAVPFYSSMFKMFGDEKNISLLGAKKNIQKKIFKDFCETYQVAKAVVSWRDMRFL